MNKVALTFVFVAVAAVASAQTITAQRYVCAAGDSSCGGTPAYSTIQAAINAAVSGDIICLKKSETFEQGTVELVDKGNLASPIIIRSCAADSLLPAAGVRITTAYNAQLPIWKSDTDNTSAVSADPAAQDYIIRFIRFQADPDSTGDIIRLGVNNSSYDTVADQPDNITLDRIIVEGDTIRGSSRGLAMNGKNLSVTNSYFTKLNTRSADGQSIFMAQGEGPFTITNNYFDSSTEQVLVGGADPTLKTTATVKSSPAPTSTVFTLENFTNGDITSMNMAIGRLVSVMIGTTAEHSKVTNITGNQLTVSPAFSSAPATGASVRWGIVPNDVTIERNYFTRPTGYYLPIMATPTNVGAVADTSSGSLAAGTYCYRVNAIAPGYDDLNTYSTAAAEKCATLTATGKVTVTWTAVSSATKYRVYGRVSNGQNMYWEVTAPTVTYADTGTAGTASSVPSGSTNFFKNSLELKAGINVTIRYNIFEYNRELDKQDGHAVVIKTVNQSGTAEFTETKNVLFEQNVMRHHAGCFKFSSAEPGSGSTLGDRPAPIEAVTVRDNLCYDIGGQWGSAPSTAISDYSLAMVDLTFENNTMMAVSHAIEFDKHALTGTNIIRNNIWPSTTNGIKGPSLAKGSATLTAFGIDSFLNNVVAGASTSGYPATTINPTQTELVTNFTEYGGTDITDYALVSGSSLLTAATDGGAVGADIAALASAVAGVVEGVPTGAPTFAVTLPPDGTENVPYSFTVVTAGGTAPRTCALAAGSGALPTGLTISSACVISGTPTTDGAYSFTVQATDALAVSSTKDYTITIANAAPTAVDITTSCPLTDGTTTTVYNVTMAATGGTGAYAWSISAGAMPTGWALDPVTGVITGTASTSGVFSFTLHVSSGSLTDDQDCSVTITTGGGGPTTGPLTPSPRPAVRNGQEIWTSASPDQPTLETYPGLRVKDTWTDNSGNVWVVTGSAPDLTFTGVGAHLVVNFVPSGTLVVNADTPDGGAEFAASMRYQLDLSRGYSQCRLMGFIDDATAVSSTVIRAEYYDGDSWEPLTDSDGTIVATSTGHKIGTFGTLATAARTDVLVRLYETDGDAADDTTLSGITALECK